jgi:hypothetical protein
MEHNAKSTAKPTIKSAASTIAFAVVAAVLGAAPAGAAVKVTFANAAQYTDGSRYDASATAVIRTHLQRLAARYLERGDSLAITVLDLDLAGYDMSSRGPFNLRVLNGATPPKIRLRYRLERNHKVIAAGEDALSDQSYLNRPGAATSSDTFKYEKAMLDDWFQQRFATGRSRNR